MSVLGTLRHRRIGISRAVLASFVVTWLALAGQTCVHAFAAGAVDLDVSAADCLHCPPAVANADHCGERVAPLCTDIDPTIGQPPGQPNEGRLGKGFPLAIAPPSAIETPSPALHPARSIGLGEPTAYSLPTRPLTLLFGVFLN